MKRTNGPSRSQNYNALWFSLVIIISLFLAKLLQWAFPSSLFLLALLLQVGLFCLFFIALIWSFVYVFRQFKSQGAKAFLPLGVNAIALILWLYFPSLNIWLKINFFVMQSARQEVVSLVRSGQLKVDSSGLVYLPPAYALTSDDGEIVVEKQEILFFTFRGIDNYGGFVHTAIDPAPQIGEIRFAGRIDEVKKFKDQWFWISAT